MLDKNIDELLKELKVIVEKLQSNDTSLNDALDLYKEGTLLVNECNNKVEKIEKEINLINGEKIEK